MYGIIGLKQAGNQRRTFIYMLMTLTAVPSELTGIRLGELEKCAIVISLKLGPVMYVLVEVCNIHSETPA